MTPGDLAAFVLLGAVLGLDVVSFPQAMISRPIVGATLAGVVSGNPMGGLLVGSILELITLETLPVGAARYPEWGSASAVAGAIFTMYAESPSAALCIAVMAGVMTAWVGGITMVGLRYLNGVAQRHYQPRLEAGDWSALLRLHWFGLAGDFVRGGAVTLGGLALFAPLGARLLAHWQATPVVSRAVVVAIASSVAGAALWQLFHATRHVFWIFACGLLCGLAGFIVA